MVRFNNDVDIAKYEPALFGELCLPWQVMIAGDAGELSGTTFSVSGVDFVGASVEAGDVIYLRSLDGSLDGVFEVVSVDSMTQLTVSVIRSDIEASAIAPPGASDISYRVGTLKPQAVEAALRLMEYFGIAPGNPTSEINVDDILDVSVLMRVSVFLVISVVYATLASSAKDENFWVKSLRYKRLFEKARERCQVFIDVDSDGFADIILNGSSVKLSRD